MLLWLANMLSEYISAFQVFQYLTFRGILGVLVALAMSLLLGPWMIRRLVENQIGQAVRNDGPQSHFSKAGTPTMGGALILVSIGLSTLLCSDLSNRFVWIVLIVTLVFGVIIWHLPIPWGLEPDAWHLFVIFMTAIVTPGLYLLY